MVLNSQLLAEFSECIIVELLSVVQDEDHGDSKVANNAFQTKLQTFFCVIMVNGSALTHLVK